jgi:type IV pilus assembly protein PilO
LPIRIRLTGSYHQFGQFVSGIAALPRIVTLHDIVIRTENKDAYDQLSLELTAKTYRYLDEDEISAAEADKKKTAVRRK